MKRTFNVWLCILVGCLVLSWGHAVEAAGTTPQPKPAAPAASQDAPALQVLESTFDFGESFEGAEVVHEYKIKNTGKTDLQVEQVRPSCGCTVASFDRTLPPGGEGKVTLKVSLKGFQGNFKKTATVFTNDPQNPRAMLIVQGNVKAVIEVRPATNIAFRGLADQQVERTVDLVSTVKPFKITKVESNLEEKVRYQVETVQEGKHYRLKIANILKQGNYSGFVKCFTDVPEKAEIAVRVSGYLEGDVSVKPLTLLVGKFAAQQPIRNGKVLVVSNRKKPFQIKKLTYDENLIKVKQEPLPQEPGFSLEISPVVENLPSGSEGRHQTTLTILTDVPSDEPQRVQIHIINTAAAPASGARAPSEDDDDEEASPQ
jgi:hypothetical protein